MTVHDRENARAWETEQYLLGDLPADERAALERDPLLRARADELSASNQEILERYPPADFAAAVRAAARASRPARSAAPARRWPRLLVAATLGTAALAAAVWIAPPTPAPSHPPDVTRVKGRGARVLLYRRAGTGVERLTAGSVAREHDVLQLAYQAGGRRNGVIVSIDGRGTVTRHLPAAGAIAAPLAAGAAVPLTEAYELDDAPGFERFYLVAADETFAVETVVDAVRRAGTDGQLDLPASMEQDSLAIEKERVR